MAISLIVTLSASTLTIYKLSLFKIVRFGPAPSIVRGLVMLMLSLYVPAATVMVSPGLAALMAAWMVAKSAGTWIVAACATDAKPRHNAATTAKPQLHVFLFMIRS